jgi:hypothetical protein
MSNNASAVLRQSMRTMRDQSCLQNAACRGCRCGLPASPISRGRKKKNWQITGTLYGWKSTDETSNDYLYNVLQCTVAGLHSSYCAYFKQNASPDFYGGVYSSKKELFSSHQQGCTTLRGTRRLLDHSGERGAVTSPELPAERKRQKEVMGLSIRHWTHAREA